MVEDGTCGFLRPVGDIDGMVEAALSLLRSPERLRQFGRAARRRALSRFSEDDIVERYRELYRRVVAPG